MSDTPQARAASDGSDQQRDELATEPENVRHPSKVVTEEDIGEEQDELATEPENVRHPSEVVTEEDIGEQ